MVQITIQFLVVKLLADTGNDGTGKSIFFEQWTGSPSFPLENVSPLSEHLKMLGVLQVQSVILSLRFIPEMAQLSPAMANVHVIANNGKLFATAGAFPNITDACALGSNIIDVERSLLSSGAVININNGNATMTHSAGNFTFSGAAAGTCIINTSGQLLTSGGLFPTTK